MRVLQLSEYIGPDGLAAADVDEPVRGGADLLVEVHAVGINFPDLLYTKGLYQHKPALPSVPGCEVAGVVLDAPPDSGFAAGDRVAAWVLEGGYADRVSIPVNTVARLPGTIDFATGAAMVVNYHTVHFGLARRGGLQAGESLLVMGAGGGIGSAAVQVGRGLGARVIAGVADESQRATATATGAEDVVVLGEGFSKEVRELTDGRGVDCVLDPLGDWLFVEATRSLAPEGRILIVGFAAGAIPEIRANRLLLRNIAAVGVAWGAFVAEVPGVVAAAAEDLNAMHAAGTVRPHISSRYAFSEIPEALRELEQGRIAGKAVATVRG